MERQLDQAANLSDAQLDRLAEVVAERLAERMTVAPPPDLVDANTIARDLSVSRSWVYENATALGAVRVGDGARARLRFDPQVVRERLGARGATSPPAGAVPRRRSSRRSKDPELLPIRGRPVTASQ